ncbi:MAG: family 78 glycoside hydrolase catalytic domain [Kiritimatiellia bacterium]
MTGLLLALAGWLGDGRPERSGADWYDEDPAPEFRAEFVLPAGRDEIEIAFAVAGMGDYAVNGVADELAPTGLAALWSPYDRTVYRIRRRHAVGDGGLLPHPATNVLSVVLGNGFYHLPPLRFWGSHCFRDVLAHGRPCFQLEVEGLERPLAWRWRETGVIRNSVYLGTEVDATRQLDGVWKPAVAVRGPKGRLMELDGRLAARVVGRTAGTSRWLREGAVQVVDFGTNAAGVPQFALADEARGTKVEIVYGERLHPDGTVNVLTQAAGQIKQAGIGGPGAPAVAAQRDAYVCAGGGERFAPPFTWHVFRYAEIRGARSLVTAAERIEVSPVGQDTETARTYRPARPQFAALHEFCRRTFLSNLTGGVQSDCPGRERLGYGGDIVATCEAYLLNWSDMRDLYLKTLQDFADEAAEDGWLTETAPYVGIADRGYGGRAGPIGWTLAVPVLMDALLRHHPEVADRVLAHYPVCARYVRLLYRKYPSGVIPTCIGDHEALVRIPDEAAATAHGHAFVRLTASFARRLGRTEDACEFEQLAARIAQTFADRYVRDGIVANGSQSAQAFGLYLGLVPADQLARAEQRLVAALEETGYAPQTGIFSTRYMLMYLSEHGRRELAEQVVLHEGYPGWLHMLSRGATTLWETWRESDNTFSNCHPMFGSVDEWILRFGNRQDESRQPQ